MKEECPFCKDNESNLIKRFDLWTVMFDKDQHFLGKLIIKLNRHLEDFAEINEKEQKELFEILNKFKKIYHLIFKSDMYNYASLGNVTRHLHIHFIPRYKNKREFENVIFEDKLYGKNCWPHENRILDVNLFNKLKKKIKNEIDKQSGDKN